MSRKSPLTANSQSFSGTVRTICSSTSPALTTPVGCASRRSPVTACQRWATWWPTSATAGPRSREATSCQPIRPPRTLGRVIKITAEVRQVDAADKRELVVDHDELLVVAVHRALVRVQRGLDPRPAHADARRGVNTGTGAPAHNSTRTSTWSASELAIELALFFTPILGGFRGLEPGGRDDGERQSAPSAAADAGGEVGSVPGGHLPADRAAAPAARRGRARTLA